MFHGTWSQHHQNYIDRWKIERENRIKWEKKLEKYRKTSNYRFNNSLKDWWSSYKHHYYWETDSDRQFAAYITTESGPYDLIDGLKDEVIKFTAYAIHQDFRGNGLGTSLFDSVCRSADRTGCSIYLVANGFNVNFKDDAKEMLNCMDEYGCGFSEHLFEDDIRVSSRRLQNWYIDKFNFQRCKTPDYHIFGHDYLKKKAQLIRISENANDDFRQKIKAFIK